MSRCFPFPPPGYENEKKSSNGELGHVHKIKRKHKKEKKENKKEERKDEDQVNSLIEKKDKKHKHRKHKKDKKKSRHGEHEFEDIKRVGLAHDSPTRREKVSFKFIERERPGTGSCNKVDIAHSEVSRQINDEIRENGMGGEQKLDKDRDNSDRNVRKRKEMDTNFFVGLGDAEDSFNKRETVGIKFVDRERLGNGKYVKIDLSEREESRLHNCKIGGNGMEKDQKTGKDGGKSNGKVRKGKEIDTESSLHNGNVQEIPKKREALSIKFVERERPCNGKCDKIDLLDNQKFLTDRDDNNGIVRKRNEINTNSSSHGNQPWVHLPVLTDKDKWSTKHLQTTFAKEVCSDIGRTAQEAKTLLVECISMSHVQNASNHALGKSVDSTSFHPSLSGRDKRSLKSLRTTFTKELSFNTGKVAQEVKNSPVECILKTRLEEASNASFEECIASTSCHPIFSGKDKQFNKCPQAACAEEVHSDGGNKLQDSKDCAVECLPESRIQFASNAALEKCAASTSSHLSFSIKDKRSIKCPQTAFPEKVLFDSGRIGQEANGVGVECKPGSRVQEASTATLQKCVTSTSCFRSFSGKDCERNGGADCKTTSHFIGHSHGTTEAVDVVPSGSRADCKTKSHFIGPSHGTSEAVDVIPSGNRADCKTTSHFIGPSHGTTEAVDVVSSGSRADEHILDVKYFHCLPPKPGCSDLDDQAWLFLSNGRKPKATEKFDHASNVWDRLLVLQPSNTYALPYVTPF
ncbi:hypothetical protein SUGI_0931420 [Cryptomeria japonica]|uniref:uncharacterized protein LOC131072973 isoform X2 n=1 Tax=Cryptomeria japonica TaxID=3369 RepID=UPI002414BDA2|nr:uncharacterized protein LOC131072973 isoform X2 [Cryptomeria japonica]GLJ44411.1 hypothetical protein SUGI_0931420 [Cryptomeria japonica]